MNTQIPRSEYPRPQFVREGWMNLNGVWQFEIDHGDSGRSRGLIQKEKLDGEILVPFCPESRLSGVEYRDFMRAVWYKRMFTLPEGAKGKCVILQFGSTAHPSARTRAAIRPSALISPTHCAMAKTRSPSARRMTRAAGISPAESRAYVMNPTAVRIPARRASGRQYGWNG